MFNRKLLKNNAKNILSRFYGKSLLAIFIVMGITFALTLLSFDYSIIEFFEMYFQLIEASITSDNDAANAALMSFADSKLPDSAISAFDTLFTAYSLLAAPLSMICFSRFFLRARENPATLSDLLHPFKKNYGNNLGTMYGMYLFIWLWTVVPMLIAMLVILLPVTFITASAMTEDNGITLSIVLYFVMLAVIYLSIAPGIIKSIEYSMIPWIMAENPKMTFKRAFQLTKAMTKGYKWKLFVLQLSFIGWYLLACLIPFGIYFLMPYMIATYAEAYTFLKARAVESGAADAADFPGLRDVTPVAESEVAAPAEADAVPAIETAASAPAIEAAPEAESVSAIETVSAESDAANAAE